MSIRISYFLAITLLLGAVSATDDKGQKILFGYNGGNGPQKWGSLSPKYAKCSSGKAQSPIDIKKKQVSSNKNLGSLIRDYKPVKATLVNHITSVAVFFEQGAGGIVVNGKNYTLKQMHWHTPSEHRIDGVQYDAELHLVHQAKDSGLAVVAILYQIGDEDPFLSKIKDELQKLSKEKCSGDQASEISVGEVDTKHIERKTRKYYRYVGSLTTPPCSENVVWTILGKVRSMSKEQVELLKAPLDPAYKSNARPVRELNGRKVEMFHELEDKEDGDKDDDKDDKKDDDKGEEEEEKGEEKEEKEEENVEKEEKDKD